MIATREIVAPDVMNEEVAAGLVRIADLLEAQEGIGETLAAARSRT